MLSFWGGCDIISPTVLNSNKDLLYAVDIGGTYSRFGLFKSADGLPRLVYSKRIATQGTNSLRELLDKASNMGFPSDPKDCYRLIVAVPGGVHDGQAMLPNVPWDADVRDIGPWSKACELINDFQAQALACLTSVMDKAQTVCVGTINNTGTLAVIGAGTGLGHGALVKSGQKWIPLASEAGHTPFPFAGRHEADFAEYLRRETGRPMPAKEDVVSGWGLARLRTFLTGQETTPESAVASIHPEDEVSRTFSEWYGRVCRSWVLSIQASGGLVLCGGVTGHAPHLAHAPRFSEAFIGNDQYSPFMQSIHIRLNLDDESGLYGAALAAIRQEQEKPIHD